jgi:dihydrofolate reductase
LLGRKVYESFYKYWPAQANNPSASDTDANFSRWLEEIPKIVFSTMLDKADWKNSRLVKDDLIGEVSKLKQQAGKDILILHSSSIAQECVKHGLLDEYWLNIHPVALGSGLPLFKERVNLKLLDSKVFDSGQVYLHYATQRG